MNKTNLMKIVLFAGAAVIFAGCMGSMNGSTYRRSETRVEQSVMFGTVESVHNVTIGGGTSGGGAVVGGVAGGVLGGTIGGGSGNTVATVLGAVGGAVAGNAIERNANTKPGVEITVKQDNGVNIVVVQEADPNESFVRGDRVRVIRAADGTTRVRPF
jgi:outer membrane lipoprotein SlyB